MSLPSPLEKGDHEVVDEVCIETTFPSPPLRVPSPRRGLDADSGERGAVNELAFSFGEGGPRSGG